MSDEPPARAGRGTSGRHLVLPLIAVTLGLLGGYSILMRSSIIDTRTEDYITTARAKGLKDGYVLRHHAFPNALLPMVTLIAINLGYVIAGAITAEIVFNWPGLGTLTIQALSARDYPVLQGMFLLVGGLGGHREPHRRHRLRVPRSAGSDVNPVAGAARGGHAHRWPLTAGPRCTRLRRPLLRPERRSHRPGDPRLLRHPRAVPRPDRRARSRRPRRPPDSPSQPPGGGYPFGTDELGRDVLNLTVHGARISMIDRADGDADHRLRRGPGRDRRGLSSAAGPTPS